MTSKVMPRAKLDSFDRKILTTLATNGRISWRTLAERINLTLTPTLRRVRRLEAEGYITGYTAIVNESRLIGNISCSVYVTLDWDVPDAGALFEQEIVKLPQLIFCGQYTPWPDYIINLYLKRLDEAYETLHLIGGFPAVKTMDTMTVVRISRHMKPMSSWPRNVPGKSRP